MIQLSTRRTIHSTLLFIKTKSRRALRGHPVALNHGDAGSAARACQTISRHVQSVDLADKDLSTHRRTWGITMSKDRRVVVKGGGDNLYKISESGGWFYAYHVDVGFISNSNTNIGKTRSLTDAIDLIKSHSGREIQEMS